MIKRKLMELHKNYTRSGKFIHAAIILDLLREKKIKLGYSRIGIEIENDLVNFCGMKYIHDYPEPPLPPLRGWISRDAILHVMWD